MARRKKSSNTLKIYLNNLPLGVLKNNAHDSLTFSYLPEWLSRASSFPISRSLPLREEPFKGGQVFAYFDNLLPDGVSLRQRIAASMAARSDQVFDLLAVVGRDCVGALQFIQENAAPPTLQDASGTPITDTEIANKLRDLRSTPLAVSQEEDFRLSIAGAQEKTAFLWQKNKWKVPHGSMPTTHIFKPQIGETQSRLSFSDSIENEWLCAQITAAFDLPTADCEIHSFDGIKALVVKRFDRVWRNSQLVRLPQEDLCQALSIPSFRKYESEGGPGVVTIMNLLNESRRREIDRRLFMKTQIVFFLLAAIDGHAKNFSVRWTPTGFELTKLYDILSVQPVVDRGRLQIQRVSMAMAHGVNRHYKIVRLSRRHFEQTAMLCRFDSREMNQIVDEVIADLPIVIEKVRSILPPKFPRDTAKSIFNGMISRISQLT